LQSVELLPNDGLFGVWAPAIEAARVPAANTDAAATIRDFFI
jgi:hypothetical protein